MERVREAVAVAEFRAALESIVHEVAELRVGRPAQDSKPRIRDVFDDEESQSDSCCLAALEDEVMKLRMERAHDAEEISASRKQVEALHVEVDRFVQENKKILRENAEHEKRLQEMGEEISKERAAKTAMSSLIETLRANQDELSECLSSILDDKQQLSLAIKRAEDSSSSTLRTLQEKNRVIDNLQKEIVRFEKKGVDQGERIDEILSENSSLKALSMKQEKQLSQFQTESVIAQTELESLNKSLEANLIITKEAQEEIKYSDERCAALAESKKQIFEDFEEARVQFEEKRTTLREELSQAQMDLVSATNNEREVSSKLDLEQSIRKVIETECEDLKASLERTEAAKVEAEKCAKQKTDEFRILSTKHDRLLQAQRAANLQQKQHQQQLQAQKQQEFQRSQDYEQQRLNHQQKSSKQSNRSFQTSTFQLNSTTSIVPHQSKPQETFLSDKASHDPYDDQHIDDNFDFYMSNNDDSSNLSSDSAPAASSSLRVVAQKLSKEASPRKNVENQAKESTPPLNPDSCPLCTEIPYGLMARCQSCKLPYHSLCLPPSKRTLGSKFVCELCDKRALKSK